MQQPVTLDDLVEMTSELSLTDQMRLIERILPDIRARLTAKDVGPRQSMLGIWKGLDIRSDEIDSARREMWADFPRGDL